MIAVGFDDPGVDGVEFIPVELKGRGLLNRIYSAVQLLAGGFEGYYWRIPYIRECLRRLEGHDADVILANDIDSLPVAIRVANGAKVIFDAHEYAPDDEGRFAGRIFFRRYKEYLCRKYIPSATRMTTVCPSIAELYARMLGVESVVVYNAPDYEDLAPRMGESDGEVIRLVHHGNAQRERRLEEMIKMMDHLDHRFELDLMLVESESDYLSRLRKLASKRRNVRIIPPVGMRDLPSALNEYDIGVYILDPVTTNQLYALPNKLFEFIQARLGIAVSPSPEMARVVKETGCGVVSRDYTAAGMAQALANLDRAAIKEFKAASHRSARELSAERTRKVLLELVHECVG